MPVQIIEKLIFLNDIGIWEIINVIILVAGVVFGSFYIIRGRRIPMLNIFTYHSKRTGINYTSLINIEFRNYVGSSIVICNPYFKYSGLRADNAAHQDSFSGETEVKFTGKNGTGLTEIEAFIPHKDHISTWVPIDPKHTEGEIQSALKNKKVGILYFTCIWVNEKPKVKKLKIKI
ncbi:MAG: hypothetical protein KBB01_04120 [Candidatus Omnitrophica bacterium]|jgi:hypothetical protein|nr:hypothetical protein [Candidatus Omnitrophota bacterium]